jgi:hypothetical protein
MTAVAKNVFHLNGKALTHEDLASRGWGEDDHPVQPELFEQVKALVVAGAAALQPFGVTAAFVQDDGRRFALSGESWSEELLMAGARLSAEVTRQTNGSAVGGYTEGLGPENFAQTLVWQAK